MSRESAYRLRARNESGLFAASWDRALQLEPEQRRQGHTHLIPDGRIARLLGTHYRRESGEFSAIGSSATESLGRRSNVNFVTFPAAFQRLLGEFPDIPVPWPGLAQH
jgi:hypothetical protein